MGVPGAHLTEGARRRGCLPVEIVPPASNGTVRLEPAGVRVPGAHLDDRALRGACLPIGVVSPADDGTDHGAEDPAGVLVAGADLGEHAREDGRRLAVEVVTPAGNGTV